MSKELILIKKEVVCDTITSLYFKSKDDSKLKKHIAGQFLPFTFVTNDKKYKDVSRVYSLSNKPNEDVYRLSIKKIEGGLMSTFLNDIAKEGDSIMANDPCGVFTIDNVPKNEPIVLLSGGIGVTPVLSMLYDEADKRDNISFVQAVQHSNLHPFKQDIDKICAEHNFKNYVFYSNPLDSDVEGKDYNVKGFVTKEWLEKNVPLNAHFYFCGPPIFMEMLEKNLSELGVSKDNIHFESFS